MQKINSLEEAVQFLKEKEVILSMLDTGLTYFALVDDKIIVKNAQSSYRILIDDFAHLFNENQFYLYERQEELIVNKEKDDEYYQWHHK